MRIGIVNDVRAACEALRRVVDSLPDHEIAWMAADGVEAVAMAKRDRPELILMDLIMPHLDGVQATRQIMAAAPCAILVVTATVSGNISLVYEAMGFGALDAVDTPMLGPAGEVSGAGALVEKIGMIAKIVGSSETKRPVRAAATAAPPKLVVVGASTGGPKAVSDLLMPLPHDWNAAVLVVHGRIQRRGAVVHVLATQLEAAVPARTGPGVGSLPYPTPPLAALPRMSRDFC